MIKSGITSGTPAKIMFGAGVFFAGVTYNTSIAPTESDILSKLIGATQEGGKVTIVPEFVSPEIDGVTVKLKEFQRKVGETATMETKFVELDPDIIAKTVIGVKGETTDKNYDVITSSELRSGHFLSGFGFIGYLMDGRPAIVLFKNALITSGLSIDAKNKNNSGSTMTVECYSDIASGVDNLPYAIFIRKESGWTAVPASSIEA